MRRFGVSIPVGAASLICWTHVAFTRQDIQRFAPRPKSGSRAEIWDGYVAALVDHGPDLFEETGIDTALEFQHFMAQIAHESGGFTIFWESGNYSADRIMQIFGEGNHSARVTEDEAERIGAIPTANDARAQALFERVYGLGNRRKAIELGNTEPGDGYKYRGCGPMQITGRKDHLRLMGGEPTYSNALKAALREFEEKGCHALAANDDLKTITRRINGGYNGLAERRVCLGRAKSIWGDFPCEVHHLSPDRPESPQIPIPARATALADDAPAKSMATSKEGNIQVANGAMGGGTALFDAQQVAVGVVQKSIASGKPVSAFEILLAVIQSPLFIVGATIAIGCAFSWAFRAKKRWHMGI